MRESGILFPIFSVPSKFGIGCFSKECYDFVDFLERSGQGYWQILPLGPTGFGNSPYQSVSSCAGNPYFIDLEGLIEDGLLTWEDVNGVFFGSDETKVDYGALYENRFDVLRKAYDRFAEKIEAADGKSDADKSDDQGANIKKDYTDFKKNESYWLDDYALFMAIKDEANGASFLSWEDDLRKREKKALNEAKKRLEKEIDFYMFIQFEFDKQWNKLKTYANEKKVKIIGDIPFYVSLDSADFWAHPEVFDVDCDLKPKTVAGCPPDAFSATGQLWGNPIYNWEKKAEVYAWWTKRMERNYELIDVIRIDHFHGFSEYYAIPSEDETAQNGTMKKGPGMDFFKALKSEIKDLRIIAEDLGNNTEENEKLLKETGFPGMKVLQYGFTSWDSYYVNHRHVNNCVVYTGTHDNTPTRAWVEEINDGQRDFTRRYINSPNSDYGGLVWDLIREAYRSVADLCIIPLQDYLCFGKEARINTPGAPEGNWEWRLRPNYLSDELASSIRLLSETYSRIPR